MDHLKRSLLFGLSVGIVIGAGNFFFILAGCAEAAQASSSGVTHDMDSVVEPDDEAPGTYYVDSETGRDDADGRSPARAWRSLDHVNSADLKPGDTVRFRCGGVWRGSLEPVSGDESAVVTYTSYGQGAKPLFLGSVPRNLAEDWVNTGGGVWATLPIEHRIGVMLIDLRQSLWRRHQEGGAGITLHTTESADGQTIRLTCENSGTASNHVQIWGPSLPVKKDTCLSMSFRARSTKPFPAPGMTLRQNSPPWTVFAQGNLEAEAIGDEWRDFNVMFTVSGSSESASIHLSLGAILPPGAVFEFQPLALHEVKRSLDDPLSVDVGNIIFDHGKVCGWKKWSVEDLKKPYDYYYDGRQERVYLYSQGNPATQHNSIELALKRHVIHQSGAHHVVFDGLAVKYGAAHGFGGGNTRQLIIRNCDLSYIGGGHQLTRSDGVPVRFGNAIEFWGAARDHLVEGCRIWEVYDAALTNQSRGENIHQENIVYRNNIIWNCEYSFEYWNNPESAVTRNIRFVNNTCVNAGVVWSHEQRPDRNGSHLMFYTNTAATSGIEIKYNIFHQVTEWGSRYSAGWETLPEMDYNLWFSKEGVMAYWFKDMIEDFGQYQEITGLDPNSIFADPQFLEPHRGDFRLSPASPARRVRPDGAPIGAELLWD